MPDLASLGVKIDTSDVRKGVIDLKKLSKAEQDAYLDSSRLKGSFDKTSVSSKRLGDQNQKTAAKTKQLSSSFGTLNNQVKSLIAGFAGIKAVTAIAVTADNMRQLEARVKLSTEATNDFTKSWETLQKQSLITGSNFSESVNLFQALTRTAPELKATTDQMLQLGRSVQELGAISGTTREAQKFSLRQLSQAMAGGVLRAEEFNSIIENTPALANAIATGMGKTTGQLRLAVVEGKALSKDVFKSILSQSDQITKDFEKMPLSFGRVKESLNIGFSNFIDEANQATSGIGSLNRKVQDFAEYIYDLDGAIAGSAFVKLSEVVAVGGALFLGMKALSIVTPVIASQLLLMEAAAVSSVSALAAGTSVTTLLTTSLTASATATWANVVAFGAMKTAVAGAFAVFAGFQLGSWVNENFVEVRQEGIKLTGSMQKAVTTIQFYWESGWEAMKAAPFVVFDEITDMIAGMLANMARFSDAMGASGIAASMRETAISITPVSTAANELESNLAELTKEFNSEINAIDDYTNAMIKRERRLDNQAGYTKAVADEQDKLNKIIIDSADPVKALTQAEKARLDALNESIEKLSKRSVSVAALDLSTISTDELEKFKQHTLESIQLLDEHKQKNLELAKSRSTEIGFLKEVEKNQKSLNDTIKSNQSILSAATDEIDRRNEAIAEVKNSYEEVRLELENFGKDIYLPTISNESLDILNRYKTKLPETREEYEALTRATKELIAVQQDWSRELSGSFKTLLADGESFTKNLGDMFDSMIDRMLNAAVEFASSQVIRGLFSGNYGQALSGLGVGVAAIAGSYLANDSSAPDRPRASRTTSQGDDRALGYQQQIAADIQSRDYFYAAQLQQFRELQTYVGVQTQLIKQGLSPYTDQLQSFFFDSSNYLTDTINRYLPDSVKDVISGITDSVSSFSQNSGLNDFANTDIQSYMVDGIVNSFSPQSFDAIGTMFQSGVQTAFSGPTMTQSIANSITPAFESGIGQAGNQISQAVSDSIPSSFSELSSSNATSATNNLGAVTGVLTSIYGVYSLINGWSEMSTSEKVINALGTVTSVVSAGASATAALASAAGSAISAGAQTVLAAIPVVGWVVAGIVNVYQTVEKALAGQRASAVDQVLTGGLGGMIENWLGMDQGEAVEAGTFGLIKNRVPNAWLETQRLAGGINDTPEGFERFSSNDPFFSHTGNKDARVGVNTAFGRTQFSTHELEQTQEEIRELFAPALGLIRDVDTNVANAINNIETAAGGVGETMAFYRNYLDAGNIINFNQEIESLDTAELIAQRYGSIADVLGQSGTRLGVAVDSWFDILSKSFGPEYGAEIFNLVGTNIESFAEIPVTITNLIQDRLKAPDIGGTADDAVKEVFSVLNAYSQLQTTIRGLGEENISDEVIAGFLVDINSIGFSVEEAGESLSLYAKVLYLAGEDITAGMNDLVAMSEEMTNADFSQFISTVGQLTALSQSLGLSTTINDLKSISTIIGDIAQTTLDTAALDEAQEYGGGAARAQLESMGIATADAMLKVVNEIMFLNNTLTFFDSSLADVGFRMDATLVKFSSGLIEVMGGLEEASATFDRLARGFLSTSAYSDYAKQNLRFTADQLKEQLERPDLNFNNFWREFGEAITPESSAETIKTWTELGDVLIGINDLTQQGNQARQQEAETRRQQIDADREAAAQLKASQDSFMAGINESLRRFDMTDFELSLDDLSLRFNDLNSEAHELGLTTDQLSEITALQAKEEEKLLAARQESLSKFSDLINATGSLLNLDPSGVNVGDLSYGLGGIDRATELISRFTEGFFSDLEQQGTAAEQAAKKAAAGIARLNFPGLTQDTFADIFTNLLATGEMTTDVLEGWLTVGDAILDAQEASEQLVTTLAGQFKDLQTESETSFKTQLDYISNIRDYVDSLKTNSQLSPLTNAQQFGESRAQFNTQLAAARAGDTDALQNITRFADTYLQNAQGYLSSSSAYTDIFNDVSAALLSISDSVITEQSDGTIISNSILDQTLALIDESKASTTQVIDALKQAFTNEELDSSGIFLQLFNEKLAANGLEGLVTAENYAEQLGIYSKEAFIPAVNANLANDLTALYNEAFPNQALDTFVIATEEIRSFLGGNPTSQHIYEAAILNNTSIEQIAVAVGTSSDKIIDWFERFGHDVSKLLQGENFTPTPAAGLTDQNILDYIATGPTPTQLYDTATEFGVSANRLGGLLSTVDPNLNTLAVNAYADSLGRPQLYNEPSVTQGPAVPESLLTDQNIRDFVNSSTSLMEVYRGAAENGITIERLARNFEGIDVDAINNFIQGAGLDPLTSEHVRATSPTPEGVLTDQNIRDYIYDPATDLADVYKKALEHGLTAQRVARNWDGIDAAFINNWTKEQGLGSLPRFAQGGITSGPSIAGEDGVEAVIPIPSGEVKARVTGNDNRELLAEMKALREEVKMLREQQPEHTQAVIDSNYDANEQASERIVNATNKQTNANRHRKMAIA